MTNDESPRRRDGRVSRRTALNRISRGIAAATLTPAVLLAGETPAEARAGAQEPEKKLGWAIVALGSLSAEIVLSPMEAFRGTTIPLDIPIRQTCGRCGGRGETWMEWCDACAGCGDVRAYHEIELRVPAGVREGERFRFSIMPTGSPHTIVDVRISIR